MSHLRVIALIVLAVLPFAAFQGAWWYVAGFLRFALAAAFGGAVVWAWLMARGRVR